MSQDAAITQVPADAHGLKVKSIRGAAVTLAAQALRFMLQLGSQVALARLLLPRDFGLVAMVAPVLMFVQIFNELGLSQATIQRPNISQPELSMLFWVNCGVSIALAAALAIASPLVGWFYGQPGVVPICAALGSLLVLSGLSAQQIALMNRRMSFTSLAAIDVTCNATAVVAGVTAAWLGFGTWSLVLMQAANSATILILAWTLSNWRPSWPRRSEGLGDLLRFGGHVTGFNLINFVCNNLDTVLLGRFGGSVTLGFYDRALRLVATPFWQISLPIARVAIALLSRLNGTDDRYRRAFLLMLQALLLLLAPLLIWIAATARIFVPLLLGQRWQAVAPIVAWLAIATILSPFSLASYWLFVSQGRTRQQVFYICVKTAVTLMAVAVGLRWGALGVAQSLAGFAVLIHGSLMWGATRTGPVNLPSVLKSCGPVLLGTLAAAGALIVAARPSTPSLPATALWLSLDLVLAYVVCGAVFLCFPGRVRIVADLWSLRSPAGK